jgi:hypothetical protein
MNKRLLTTVCAFLCTLLSIAQQGVGYSDHWWKPSGEVRSIARKDGAVYIAGAFHALYQPRPNSSIIDATTAIANLDVAYPNSTVSAAEPDGAGGWYIGGAFTMVGAETRNNIARINADGSLHPWNPGANSLVNAIRMGGDKLYVGGTFTTIGGQARTYLACFDTTTGNVTSWNPVLSTPGSVLSMVVSGNNVYIGGALSQIGAPGNVVTRNKIACVDAVTGNATSWNPNANGNVNKLLLVGTTMYVGGAFGTIGGSTRNGLAAISTATGTATSWNPAPGFATVWALEAYGTKLYVGGSFTTIGGQTRNGLASFNLNNNSITTWNPQPDFGGIYALKAAHGVLYASGGFTSFASTAVPVRGIAALDTTSGTATSWSPLMYGYANVISVNGNSIYTGGNYTSVNIKLRQNIAALDEATGEPLPWTANTNQAVHSLTVLGDKVYAGGYFTTIGGVARNYAAALHTATGAVLSWNPNANNRVRALYAQGETVYAGGDFTTIGGASRGRLAALDTSAGNATSWQADADQRVWTITTGGTTNHVYAGGEFTTVGGQLRDRIVDIDAATGVINSLNAGANGTVYTLAVGGDILYAGGIFTTIGGQTRNRIAAIDCSSGNVTTWNPNINNMVKTIATRDNTVYAGGVFNQVNGGTLRFKLASIDATTGTVLTWNPNANGFNDTIMCLLPTIDKLYTGGNISTMGGNLNRKFFIPLTDSAQLPQNSITVGPYVTPGNFCQNGSVSVGVEATGSFNAGNVFSLELSDMAGSFASPTVLGTVAATTNASIDGLIPTSMSAGSGYRFRITSSSPALTTPDNGADITIYSYPSAAEATLNVTGTASVCTGGALALSVPSTPGFMYRWRLDGTLIPGATNNTYMATTAGTYQATVINPNLCYRTTDTVAVTVTSCTPVITQVSPSPALCRDRDVAITFSANGFAAGNVFTAQLSNGSGSFASPVVLGTLTSTTGGVITGTIAAGQSSGTGYRVRIVSSSPATTGADNGVNLSMNALPSSTVSSLSPAGTQTVCQGATVMLYATSTAGITYQWQLNGVDIAGATGNSIDAGQQGNYSLSVTNAAGCSRTSANKLVNIITPVATIIAPLADTAVCTPVSVTLKAATATGNTYQWNIGGNPIAGATASTYTATATGSYTVTVTKSGCSLTSAARNINPAACSAAPAITSLSPATQICQGGNVVVAFTAQGMTAGNVYTVQLSSAAGSFASPLTIGMLNSDATSGTITAVIPSNQAAGIGYRIRIVSSAPALTGADNGTNLTVNTPPATVNATISPSTSPVTICSGTTYTYSVPAIAGHSYQWSLSNINIAGATNNTYAASQTGPYRVLVTNAAGCTKLSGSRSLTVATGATAQIISPSTPPNLCNGATATLQATVASGYTFQWKLDGNNIPGATNSSYVASAAGSYTVTVVNGTCTATSAPLTATANCSAVITSQGTATRCPGDTITVAFTATANAGNIFSLQLSDASGDFTGASTLNTIPGTTGGIITGFIPQGTPDGSGYKLRINSSNPASTGAASPLTLVVASAAIVPVAICAVTVDDATGKNKIIFDKPMVSGIDSFVFYRRPNAGTAYERVGAIAYSAASIWTDQGSDPMARAHR